MGDEEPSYIGDLRLGLAATMLANAVERYRFWLVVSILANVALTAIVVAMVVS